MQDTTPIWRMLNNLKNSNVITIEHDDGPFTYKYLWTTVYDMYCSRILKGLPEVYMHWCYARCEHCRVTADDIAKTIQMPKEDTNQRLYNLM